MTGLILTPRIYMQVIILAAGEGTRLRPYTESVPKCMIPLMGRPLLHWQLKALEQAGLKDICVVTGYKSEVIERAFPQLEFFHNEEFAQSNMVHSLYAARKALARGKDVLVAYSDIVYQPEIIQNLLSAPAPEGGVLLASNSGWRELWQLRMEDVMADAESFILDESGHVLKLGEKTDNPDHVQGQYTGLFVLQAEEAARTPALYEALPPEAALEGRPKKQIFMTAWLQYRIDAGVPVKAVEKNGGWLEVDTVDDLLLYRAWAESGLLEKFWNFYQTDGKRQQC